MGPEQGTPSCFNYFWHNVLFQDLLIEIKQLPHLDRDNKDLMLPSSLISQGLTGCEETRGNLVLTASRSPSG